MGTLQSSPANISCTQEISYLYATKYSYSQVAPSFGTPSFAPSSLLWFFSLIFFSCNLSSSTHVLQIFIPGSIEMWIVHIYISYNITSNTKRTNQIHKNQICTNNLYLHILETFSELSPLFASIYFFEVGTELPNFEFLKIPRKFQRGTTMLAVVLL